MYHYFAKMLDHFKDDRIILPKVKKRWNFIRKDIHSLAYILTPKFALTDVYIDGQMEEMIKIKRYAENRDPERAKETMDQMVQYLNDLSTLPPDQKELIETMSASQYWNIFGKNKYPLLFLSAKSINSMICSSAASERVWSIFGFIHKPLRNRLSNEKVEKLVFLYVNSGLLDEKDKNDYIFDESFAFIDDFYE